MFPVTDSQQISFMYTNKLIINLAQLFINHVPLMQLAVEKWRTLPVRTLSDWFVWNEAVSRPTRGSAIRDVSLYSDL